MASGRRFRFCLNYRGVEECYCPWNDRHVRSHPDVGPNAWASVYESSLLSTSSA
jgi:hypothetical protein